MIKKYNSAPLPFQGQKRGMVKHFSQEIKKLDKNALVVDLFGGSGLLSHTAKFVNPNLTVVYNDFDNYTQRLAHIDLTNEILVELRTVLEGTKKDARLSPETHKRVIGVFAEAEMYGFVDYLTLSQNVLFSGNYASSLQDMKSTTMYSRVVKHPYNAEGYLEGVHIVSDDYRNIITNYSRDPNVVFLADPPYLTTDVTSYADLYWKLTDYLDVLDQLRGQQFIYFTSEKSNLVELCGWIGAHEPRLDLFRNCKVIKNSVTTSYRTSYNDLMLSRLNVDNWLY